MTRIESYGWRGAVEPGVGRVVRAHGDYYSLVCNEAEGEIPARKKKSAFTRMKTSAPDSMKGAKISEVRMTAPPAPVTGDFVRFAYNPGGDSMITEVLPRFSRFERRDPAARRTSQTLAVNFDVLFLVMSLDANFSLRRLARYLELAADVGEAETVLLLTKRDVAGDVAHEMLRESVELAGCAAECLAVSAVSGEGIDAVRKMLAPGRTAALVGSSGVGKSTLLNTLIGEEVAAVGEIQSWSGKGRHTTTSRRLFMLPWGAMVVDTPGIREIGAVGEAEAVLAKGASTHRYRVAGGAIGK